MKLRKVITTAGFIMANITPANAQLYMCKSCPAGTYSDGTFTSCKNCLTTGVANCDSVTGKATSCKPGYGLSNGTCTKCSAGYYSAGGTASCTKCPAGSYSSTTGSTSCTKCSAGYYSSSAGSTSCTKCPQDTYSANAGATSCTACQKYYLAKEGSSSCYQNWDFLKQWIDGPYDVVPGIYKIETSGAGGSGGGGSATIWHHVCGGDGGNGYTNSEIFEFTSDTRVWALAGWFVTGGAGGSFGGVGVKGQDGNPTWVSFTHTDAIFNGSDKNVYAAGGTGGTGAPNSSSGSKPAKASGGNGAAGGTGGCYDGDWGVIGGTSSSGWVKIYKLTRNAPTRR